MLLHNRPRLAFTIAGIAVAFFLAAAQFGLLVGWINTLTALIRHARADLWVMAEQTPAFDYGTAIPRQRVNQARSVPGVAWAEGLFMGWNIWQRPDGRRINVELVGLDVSHRGGPWEMHAGELTNSDSLAGRCLPQKRIYFFVEFQFHQNFLATESDQKIWKPLCTKTQKL